MSTRRGEVVLLQDVLNEAKERALETLRVTKSKSLSFTFSLVLPSLETSCCIRSKKTND